MAKEKKSDTSGENSKDTGSENSKNNGNNSEKESQEISIYEWIVAALGSILVFGSIGFMTYKAITATDTPPDLSVKTKSVEKVKSGYLVKFEVKNDGEYAASVAVIKGELKKGKETEESSTTTIAYVPSYSTRSGGMFFTNNPKDFELDVRATGYTEP